MYFLYSPTLLPSSTSFLSFCGGEEWSPGTWVQNVAYSFRIALVMTMGSLLSHSLRQVLLIPFHSNHKEKEKKQANKREETAIPSCLNRPWRGFISLPLSGVLRRSSRNSQVLFFCSCHGPPFSFLVKFPSKCFSDYIKTLGLLSLRKEKLVNTMWAKVHFEILDAGWCD